VHLLRDRLEPIQHRAPGLGERPTDTVDLVLHILTIAFSPVIATLSVYQG